MSVLWILILVGLAVAISGLVEVFFGRPGRGDILDRSCRWLAWRLPRRLVMWCGYRIGANATTGVHGSTVVPELRFMDAMQRWPVPVLIACALLWPEASRAEAPGARFDATTFGLVTMSGDADPTAVVTPGARISVDGPLAFGESAIGRVYTRLDFTALPGETLDLSKVETVRGLELSLGVGRDIGRLRVGSQEIVTAIVGEWGFGTRLSADAAPLTRYPRHYGAGVRIEERESGAQIALLYGRAEIGGDRGYGQWQISGQLPIGPAVLGGDAVLSVGPPGVFRQRDVVRVFVGVSVPELVRRLR